MLRGVDIIGVFDIDICTVEKRLRDYLSQEQRDGGIVETAEDLPSSFIVTKDKVYISGLSSGILRQRVQHATY